MYIYIHIYIYIYYAISARVVEYHEEVEQHDAADDRDEEVQEVPGALGGGAAGSEGHAETHVHHVLQETYSATITTATQHVGSLLSVCDGVCCVCVRVCMYVRTRLYVCLRVLSASVLLGVVCECWLCCLLTRGFLSVRVCRREVAVKGAD